VLAVLVLRLSTFHPPPVSSVPVVSLTDEVLPPSGEDGIRVMVWNLQYLAGKDHVFFYDLPNDGGPDDRPSTESLLRTRKGVQALIRERQPDILLLQELDDGASRSDLDDQLELLLEGWEGQFAASAEAFYWRGVFVPHPRIMGRVGMKLATLSRFPILRAERYQLPIIPSDPVTRLFNFRRCILETLVDHPQWGPFMVMNTHLDAFSGETDTM